MILWHHQWPDVKQEERFEGAAVRRHIFLRLTVPSKPWTPGMEATGWTFLARERWDEYLTEEEYRDTRVVRAYERWVEWYPQGADQATNKAEFFRSLRGWNTTTNIIERYWYVWNIVTNERTYLKNKPTLGDFILLETMEKKYLKAIAGDRR